MAATKAELDYALRLRRWGVYQQWVKYTSVVACVWILARYGFLGLRELAGRATTADILVRLLLGIHTSKGLALLCSWLLTGSCTGWAVLERRGRKKLIARFHPEDRKRQLRTDPMKQSSGITITGDTGPDDL